MTEFNNMFEQICKFLKYSGDQATILEMELNSDALVLISRDRNVISRSTVDPRVKKYACPYMDAFRRNSMFNLKLTKLPDLMIKDEFPNTNPKDMEDGIRRSKSHVQDLYDFLVIYTDHEDNYTVIDHLKHRGYIYTNKVVTEKIKIELNVALENLINYFVGYFEINRTLSQRVASSIELSLNNHTKQTFWKGYYNETAYALGLIKDVMSIFDLLNMVDNITLSIDDLNIVSKLNILIKLLNERGFLHPEFVFVPPKTGAKNRVLNINKTTSIYNGIKTTQIQPDPNLFEIVDDDGNLKNIKIFKLTKDLFKEVYDAVNKLKALYEPSSSAMQIGGQGGPKPMYDYDFITYVSLETKKGKKEYDLQDYENQSVKKFYQEYDEANAHQTNFLIYVIKMSRARELAKNRQLIYVADPLSESSQSSEGSFGYSSSSSSSSRSSVPKTPTKSKSTRKYSSSPQTRRKSLHPGPGSKRSRSRSRDKRSL
jgi:hypothetical protein